MTIGRRARDPVLGRSILVVLIAAALSTPLLAAPRYLIARFQNHLSPHLQDADEAFVVGDSAVLPVPPAADPEPLLFLGSALHHQLVSPDVVEIR